jgi:hypothetical protein
MKGLKKIALASTIAAVSAGAQAELKALDDAMMGELTGQAGLTIDIETEYTIGEFAYQDAGFVLLRGMHMGGNENVATGGKLMDNIRLTLDVAGSGAATHKNAAGQDVLDNHSKYGMSEVRDLAALVYSKGGDAATFGAAATGVVAAGQFAGGTIDEERVSGNGDLTLHFGFTDAFKNAGGFGAFATGNGTLLDASGSAVTFATLEWNDAVDMVATAVDFEFTLDEIAIAASDYSVGAGLGNQGASSAQQTTLISDLKMSGYVGPVDIIIENHGNDFGAYDASGNFTASANDAGDAASKILWDAYVKVTDLDLYIDIAGVQLSDIKIHNVRGDLNGVDGNTAFGFAHSKREIFAVKDAVLNIADTHLNGTSYVDGIAINTQFAGDIDIGGISFGDTAASIGSIYITDLTSTTNWTISAH